MLIEWPRRVAGYFTWLPPLVARIVVGWVFLWTGWGKLNALPRMIRISGSGDPHPEILTPFVSGVEFIGGILLLLGFLTRIAAVPLVVVMIVAVISAKLGEVDLSGDVARFRGISYLALFLWLAIAGPGPISIDHALESDSRKERTLFR